MPDATTTTNAPSTSATVTAVPTPPPAPAPAAAVPAEPPTTDEPLGDTGKSALVKEREARAAAEKRAADAEKKAKEYEDRDKSEAQKLDEENTRLKAENATLAHENLRRDVAAEKGLTPAQAKRLVGTTRDELVADADDILTSFPSTPPTPHIPDVGQGVRGTAGGTRYRQSQLNDHTFWLANKADITLAMAEGRIDPD